MRLALFTLALSGAFSVAVAQTPIDVQPVKELVRTGTLATCGYTPVAQEEPSFKKLEKDETVTGSFLAPYSIHEKRGKFVSWFGLVRGITASENKRQLTLLLQHKYFDGMTDCHIMLVSNSGGGDFRATLETDAAAIPALALVRIYGRVTDEKNKIPEIAAEYVRVWPWLTFTFSELGAGDKSNPKWAKYAKTGKGWRVYDPYPKEDYYRRMLGDPKDFGLNLKLD
jgi:hypothetical protein